MLTAVDVRTAVATAVRAPSVHNTQPWVLTQLGDSIEVRADRNRWLRYEDPVGRELMISCGGALRHLALALRAQGFEVRTQILPDPSEPDLVGVVSTTGRRSPSLVERELHDAIGYRHTERSPFSSEPVTPALVERLRSIAELEDCVLTVLDDDATLLLSVLTSRAERTLHLDPQLSSEQDAWTSPLSRPVEGVPRGALPEHGRRRGSPVTLRDFAGLTADDGDHEPPPVEHPTLIVLSSPQDDAASWISTGWTLTDLLLTLTSEGLVASPLTQALELEGSRMRLRSGLGLQSHPQMVLRVGHPGPHPSPEAGRRPVEDVLR